MGFFNMGDSVEDLQYNCVERDRNENL